MNSTHFFQITRKPFPNQRLTDLAKGMAPGDCVERLPAKAAKILRDEIVDLYGEGSVVFRSEKSSWTVWRKK